MPERTDTSEMRMFRPQSGHTLACYCEKRAATGYSWASLNLRYCDQVVPTSITMCGREYPLNIPAASALCQSTHRCYPGICGACVAGFLVDPANAVRRAGPRAIDAGI